MVAETQSVVRNSGVIYRRPAAQLATEIYSIRLAKSRARSLGLAPGPETGTPKRRGSRLFGNCLYQESFNHGDRNRNKGCHDGANSKI